MSKYTFTAQDARDIVIKHQGNFVSRGFINDSIMRAAKQLKTSIEVGTEISAEVVASLNNDGFTVIPVQREFGTTYKISWSNDSNAKEVKTEEVKPQEESASS